MPLLNYTTTISVDKTVAEITRKLVGAGARQVLTEYGDDGDAIAISFLIETPAGAQQYRLPVRSGAVHEVLLRDRVPPKYRTPEQADRVAWRITKVWLEAQLALLETEMVGLDEIMLPYLLMPSLNAAGERATLYDVVREGGLKELNP